MWTKSFATYCHYPDKYRNIQKRLVSKKRKDFYQTKYTYTDISFFSLKYLNLY